MENFNLSDDIMSGLADYLEDSPDENPSQDNSVQVPPDILHPLKPNKVNQWDPRFVLDLALGIDGLDDILQRYGLSRREFEKLAEVPAFRKDLSTTKRDIHENGTTFKRKAQVQAEEYLEVIDTLIHSSNTPEGIRLEAIKSVVKWGDLEPKDTKRDDNATAVNIQINF